MTIILNAIYVILLFALGILFYAIGVLLFGLLVGFNVKLIIESWLAWVRKKLSL